MVGSSDFGGLVVLQHVRGGAIAAGLGGGGRLGRVNLGPFSGADDRGGHTCAAQSRGQQEVTAVGGFDRFHLEPPFCEACASIQQERFGLERHEGGPERGHL